MLLISLYNYCTISYNQGDNVAQSVRALNNNRKVASLMSKTSCCVFEKTLTTIVPNSCSDIQWKRAQVHNCMVDDSQFNS